MVGGGAVGVVGRGGGGRWGGEPGRGRKVPEVVVRLGRGKVGLGQGRTAGGKLGDKSLHARQGERGEDQRFTVANHESDKGLEGGARRGKEGQGGARVRLRSDSLHVAAEGR